MNCPFCGQYLKIHNSWDADEHLTAQQQYICNNCSANYIMQNMQMLVYYFDYKNYRLYFDIPQNSFTLAVTYPASDIPGIFQRIIKLDYLPEITLDNIENKINTLITFQ